MNRQDIIFSSDIASAVLRQSYDKLFTLSDDTTSRLCLPRVEGLPEVAGNIVIAHGDTNKTVEASARVWTELQRMGATRHSLLVNVGGGMLTDLGGFAASTFKRGLGFINVPTTLLAMVDASVGGKTGVNFGGLKNEIGVFADARTVVIDTRFLTTLDRENILSGYAEMIKHGLISDETHWHDLLSFDIEAACGEEGQDRTMALTTLSQMIGRSVRVKEDIVIADPREQGIRKALNLGHTAGHAFESLAMRRGKPILHGYAVAYGLIAELYLAATKTGLTENVLHEAAHFINGHYGKMPIDCDDYDELIALMRHDKKNTAGHINFTLIGAIGDIRIDQTATDEEIREALDFYREC